MRLISLRVPALFTLGLAAALAFGQAKNPNIDTLHLKTALGSFKFFNGSGTIHLKFKGTVLLTFFHGTVTPAGNVRKEFPVPQIGKVVERDGGVRQAFHGDGEITINGDFKSVQWFGRDLDGTWVGTGGFRLFGEYDKDLNTGLFWYGSDTEHIEQWGVGSGDRLLPRNANQPRPVLKG